MSIKQSAQVSVVLNKVGLTPLEIHSKESLAVTVGTNATVS